uniref:Retrovirus-related Pol polyprotein from transposon TNT 1-94 n=1 Tax=Photinus pyralis TaxID=7054 RepID=A0A1Y1K2V0_PHOPY
MEHQEGSIEKLRGTDNWTVWKFAIRNVLRAYTNAYEICNGDLRMPEALNEEATAEQKAEYIRDLKIWDKADRIASQALVKALEPKIMALLVTCNTARQMWIKLHSIFEQQTKQAAHVVQAEFFSFTMNEKDDMVTHISKFETLILKMNALNVKQDDMSLVVKLLDTLPDNYDNLRQAWWARPDEQQTFNNLVNVLTSEESRRKQRHLQSEASEESTGALLAGRYRSKSQISHKKNTTKGVTTKKTFTCYGCGGKNHIKRNCPNRKQKFYNEESGENAFITEVLNAENDEDFWIVDSGATDHLTYHGEWFSSFEQFKTPVKVHIGNKTSMDALGKGVVEVKTFVDGKIFDFRMLNVLFVPAARRNLFSMTAALDKGYEFKSNQKECFFVSDEKTKAKGRRVGQLFTMIMKVKVPANSLLQLSNTKETNVTSKLKSIQEWHEMLGHQNRVQVEKVLNRNGIEYTKQDFFCEACVKGKQHRKVFQVRQQRAQREGEVMNVDLCGPMEITSYGGSRYFICFTCDYSKFRLIKFLKEKSETTKGIAEVLNFVKNQCGRPLKMLRCDGGGEFNNKDVTTLLKSEGVILSVSNPYTSEQNGCAERSNRTVVELARTMLAAKDLPKGLWAEAVNTAVYLLNRTGPSNENGKSPLEIFTGKSTHLNKLHVFGTTCFVHKPKQVRKKWDPKCQKGIFVGYSEEMDGFRVWLSSTRKILRSRDVVFEPVNCTDHSNEEKSISKMITFDINLDEKPNYVAEYPGENRFVREKEIEQVENENIDAENELQESEEDRQNHENIDVDDNELRESEEEDGQDQPRYNFRNRRNLHCTKRLIETMIAEVDEPKSYQEAVESPESRHWKQAMEEEMQSLIENHTWILVDLPENRKAITNRWTFKFKKKVEEKVLSVKHITSEDQLGDILTIN